MSEKIRKAYRPDQTPDSVIDAAAPFYFELLRDYLWMVWQEEKLSGRYRRFSDFVGFYTSLFAQLAQEPGRHTAMRKARVTRERIEDEGGRILQ